MLLTLCLTHDCNLRCTYCYAGRKFQHRMSHAIAKQAIDLGVAECLRQSESGAAKTLTLRFFGGEPLLEWERLQDATQYCREKTGEKGITLNLTVTTNGVLMTRERVNWMFQQGMHVVLSLDGNPDMHNTLRKFRNGRDSHKQCVRSLGWLRTTFDNAFEVLMVVDPRNVKFVGDSVRWLLSEGVRDITLNPNFHADWDARSRTLWRKEYRKVCALYVAGYRSGEPVKINFIDSKITTGILDGFAACSVCGFGDDELAIAPSGNIYPCERVVADDTDDALRIGNVLTGFDTHARQNIRSGRGTANIECIDCAYRPRCMNWCCCINYATTGQTDMVDGTICYYERMTIQLADTVASTLYDEANPLFLRAFYAE